MTAIEPELWVDRPRAALAFYETAFGDGEDIVARLAVVGHEWEIGRPVG